MNNLGTPGVPWDKSKEEIVEALKKNKGKLTHAAKSLKCCYDTIRKYTDQDPELVQLISDLRQSHDNELLDTAEDVILHGMTQQTDLTNALKAAFFVLNSKGTSRNWNNTNVAGNTIYFVKQDPTKCDDKNVS